MKRTVRVALLHIIVPLLFGSIIYVFWRDPSLPISRLPVISNFGALRVTASFIHVPAFFLYSLPDAVWAYSLTSFMMLVWRDSDSRFRLVWISSGLVAPIVVELGQLVGWFPGTFDVRDLIASTSAALLAFYLNSTSNPLKRMVNATGT